jgi:endonuclease/exonuclease/phosphatase family metal-dependent hydrolase
MMNGHFQQAAGPCVNNLAGLVVGAAGLVLVIGSGGCATSRPAPLLIEHPLLAAPELEPRQNLSLKLVTYNIWGLPSWMTGAGPGRYARIERELERLDPDVVLLQEAWTAKARKSAPANGHWCVARAAWQHTFFQQSGLMTLSRFPIIGGQFYPFSRAAFPDRFVNKGVLKTTVRLANGQVLNIWNVHLQDGGSAAIRASQVGQLVARVKAAEDGQLADIVAGDFNCTPDSPLYRELSDAFGPSAQDLSGKSPFVTFDGLSGKGGPRETLDHIFIRRSSPFQSVRASSHVAFSAARREERLSDHFGIEAVLNVSTEPALAGAIGPTFSSPGVLNLVPDFETQPAGD